MKRGVDPERDERKSWPSTVDAIPLRHPLRIRVNKNAHGYTVRCKAFRLIGDGSTLRLALQMLYDHLLIDYYEYSLNPGPSTVDERAYGRRLRALFNDERSPTGGRKKLLDFHPEP